MASLKEMAESHLNNIQTAILDLQKQKQNIDQEIAKLTQYLQEGIQEINKESNTSPEVVEK